MHWEALHLSHHSTETTSCALSLCNTEYESNHFLAVGKNIGEIDLVNLDSREIIAGYSDVHSDKVLGVDFLTPFQIISFDKNKVILTDAITSDRKTLFDTGSTIYAMSHPFQSAPIVVSSSDGIYFVQNNDQNVKICDSDNVTELCLLHDTNTLLTVRGTELGVLDFRRPEYIRSLGLSFGVVSMMCNETHLAVVSKTQTLYTFDLPLLKDSYKEHVPIFNTFPARPSFIGKLVCVADGMGSIFIIDPENNEDFQSLSVQLDTPAVCLTANDSEIAIALEDDIFVYSQFPYEDNLVRAPYIDDEILAEEEENEQERDGWLNQSADIVAEQGECTYEKYGYCDQLIYVCRDCMRESEPFGICEQCAKMCHQGHDVRPIGIRHNFRCDCGNDRSRRPCSAMIKAKTATNPHNTYGHNFYDRWCTCDGPDEGSMVQCRCCSEWFHTSTCIGMFPKGQSIPLEDIPELQDPDWIFICTECLNEKLTFLKNIPDSVPIDFLNELIAEASAELGFQRPKQDPENGVGFTVKGGRWIPIHKFEEFHDEPEYKQQFSKLDTTEEDKTLKRASRQDEYVNAMRELYMGLFQQARSQGKTVAQASDVHEIMNKTVTGMYIRQHEHDDDDHNQTV